MTSNRRQFIAASAVGVLGTLGYRMSDAQQSDSPIAFQRQVGAINWYCELQGRGAPVVLIPSGEGDCGSFAKVASLLATEFRVLTFDMPGFSRSSDPPNFESYSVSQAASEIAALLRALELHPATVYGCSSGGQFALRLASEHPDLVRRAVVHEVAPAAPVPASAESSPAPALSPTGTDEEIVLACKSIFRNGGNADPEAWDALGEEYHRRLERNYVTWVRRYFGLPDMRMPTPEELHRRPVTWTVGALTNPAAFANNLAAAEAAGIEVGRLMSRHFPQVSIPAALAEHIGNAARA
jgi:pimeloyl-ACP methyl ester carboxylesterase